MSNIQINLLKVYSDHKWRYRLKFFRYKIKYIYQRITTGVSIYDMCDLGEYTVAIIVNGLRTLANHHHGIPGPFWSKYKECETDELSEKWRDYLLSLALKIENKETRSYGLHEYINNIDMFWD